MENAARKIEPKLALSLTIEKNALLGSLSKLQSFVEKRNTIPILSNVKLDADQNGLTLTVTDMDLVVSETVEAAVSEEGSLTVPATTLYDIIRKLPEGAQVKLDLDTKSSRVNIKSGNSKFTLSYLPSDDFPVMSEGTLTHQFSLKSKDFLKLIEKTRFAMSTEETRYYLNGVYFHTVENSLKTVSTDGHRLAKVEIEAPEGTKGMPGVIIPRKAVNEINKILENQEEVKISLSDSKIKFNAGKIELLSKVVDGTFPDYARVIPENNVKFLTVNSNLVREAIDRVATITADKTRAVKLNLSKNNLNISAQGIEGISGNENVECTYQSDAIEAGFNSRYLLEMLSLVEGVETNFAFDTANSPVIVTDSKDTSALFIIMPMRV
ncbi:MAG TPA: DNA polymerase III subunit beta [Alphaproteobacteria bacterium]|nr:DNA polymerase III subunit beta [Alphaproteobacteria bacterium]